MSLSLVHKIHFTWLASCKVIYIYSVHTYIIFLKPFPIWLTIPLMPEPPGYLLWIHPELINQSPWATLATINECRNFCFSSCFSAGTGFNSQQNRCRRWSQCESNWEGDALIDPHINRLRSLLCPVGPGVTHSTQSLTDRQNCSGPGHSRLRGSFGEYLKAGWWVVLFYFIICYEGPPSIAVDSGVEETKVQPTLV